MFMNLLINSYLKNMSVEKAILVSKQLCINFDYTEMSLVLPYIKNNWQDFLDEKKRAVLLANLSNKTCPDTTKKVDALLNKLLIIFS